MYLLEKDFAVCVWYKQGSIEQSFQKEMCSYK